MGIVLHILYQQLLKYIFAPMLIIYIIGKPKFLIELLNKFLLIRDPLYKIRIFFFLAFFFVGSIFQTFYRQYNISQLLDEEYSKTNPNSYNAQIDNYIRTSFLFQRNINIYIFFFVSIIIFLKFSRVYEKTYELENRLKELRHNTNHNNHNNHNYNE